MFLMKLKLIYYRRSVGQSVLVSGSHLEPTTSFVWHWRSSYCGAHSLTRGWVCNLLVQLLLGLITAASLGFKSRRTHDHTLLSHMRLLQPGGPGPRIYLAQEQDDPVIPPANGFPFQRFLRLAGLRRYFNPPPPLLVVHTFAAEELSRHSLRRRRNRLDALLAVA
jgi:hypothetical protein